MTASAAFLLPELRADKGRVTSGCPSLSPIERVTRDYRYRQRIKTRAAYKDGVDKQERAIAPDGDRPRTILEAQLGRPMMGTEFQKRVAFLCPSLFFEQSIAFPDRMLIYRKGAGPEGRHLVCAFQRGWSPEFSVRDSSTGGETVRGWRNALEILIKSGYMGKEQADKVFGLPGRDSRNWQQVIT